MTEACNRPSSRPFHRQPYTCPLLLKSIPTPNNGHTTLFVSGLGFLSEFFLARLFLLLWLLPYHTWFRYMSSSNTHTMLASAFLNRTVILSWVCQNGVWLPTDQSMLINFQLFLTHMKKSSFYCMLLHMPGDTWLCPAYYKDLLFSQLISSHTPSVWHKKIHINSMPWNMHHQTKMDRTLLLLMQHPFSVSFWAV